MEVIEQSSEYLGIAPSDPEKMIDHIADCARVCYQKRETSNKTPTETCTGLFTSGHHAAIEHSNLVFCYYKPRKLVIAKNIIGAPKFKNLPDIYNYIRISNIGDYTYLHGNFRAWYNHFIGDKLDNKVFPDIQILIEFIVDNAPLEYIDDQNEIPDECKALTFSFITSRDVTHQIVRHRPAAYCQESQKYVGYEKSGVKFVRPLGLQIDSNSYASKSYGTWYNSMFFAEQAYNELTESVKEEKLIKEIRRTVLPNSTASEIIMTADLPEWRYICNLRQVKNGASAGISDLMLSVRKTINTEFPNFQF